MKHSKPMKHPIQPLELDDRKVLRFKPNKIVQYLLDNGPFDMNHLAVQSFSAEDREQFIQLIGYSLSGAGELGYVSPETYEAAEIMYKSGAGEVEARNANLRELILVLKEELREPIATLYGIHPDDLI